MEKFKNSGKVMEAANHSKNSAGEAENSVKHGAKLKKYLVLCVFVFISSFALAQGNLQDVIHLRNGSIIRGVIIEQVPNVSIRLQTVDGNIFVFQIDEIERMTREQPIGFQQQGRQTAPSRTQIESTGDIVADMKIHSPELYSQYRSGRKMQTTGMILTFGGIAASIAGSVAISSNNNTYNTSLSSDRNNNNAGGVILYIAGVGCIGAGVPIWIVGVSKKGKAKRNFDSQYYSSKSVLPHFQLNVSQNKVGVAYVF